MNGGRPGAGIQALARIERRYPLFSRLWGLAFLALVAGCRSPVANDTTPLERFEFESAHMGTMFSIQLYAPEKEQARAAAEAAFRRVAHLDEIMSDYQVDSELMRLCEVTPRAAVPVSPELLDVLEQAQKFSQLTEGAFDVTVGPVVHLWRFSRKRKVLPSPEELKVAVAAVGYRNLVLNSQTHTVTLLAPHMRLDLGGIAKGYAADQALDVLKRHGFKRALVAASGDIALGDPPPGQQGWKVGISAIDASPDIASQSIWLHNAGISTSGDTEQFVEIGGTRYSHIVNPATGLGLTNRVQVTVIAPNATTTDALATGICVLGPERGLAVANSLPHVAALIISKTNGTTSVRTSRQFKRVARPN